jgi:glycosyltransferase involved in cell wall biosynthesis
MRDDRAVWGTLDPFFEGGVMGRTMANGSFLDALLRRDDFAEYHFFLPDRSKCRALAQSIEERGLGRGNVRLFLRRELPAALARENYHCFHLSDCLNSPAQLARLRNLCSPRVFPITSTTHSLSYHEYPARFLLHAWPGSTGRDCVVATSSAGRQVVERLYSLAAQHCGGSARPVVREIPLGVDLVSCRPPTGEQKAQARAELSIVPGETVLLAFGRISPHSKMDLLPLLRAVQRARRGGPDKVRLVISGWTDSGDDLPGTLAEVARNIGVPLTVSLRPDERLKQALFRASDIFLSPADNPQETFGLTLLEAGAFGLPAIASDYDGYRDLIEDGRTGFLVPTIGPSETELVDALAPLCGDGHSHLLLGQRTVVCVPEMAERIARLAGDPGLRMAMGDAARQRVEASYSWESVIERHLALWDELWRVPVPQGLAAVPHPLGFPYAGVFSHYPTELLEPGLVLRWTAAGRALHRGREHPLLYSGVEEVVSADTLRVILFLFRLPRSVGQVMGLLSGECPDQSEEDLQATILWALKHDLLERA